MTRPAYQEIAVALYSERHQQPDTLYAGKPAWQGTFASETAARDYLRKQRERDGLSSGSPAADAVFLGIVAFCATAMGAMICAAVGFYLGE